MPGKWGENVGKMQAHGGLEEERGGMCEYAILMPNLSKFAHRDAGTMRVSLPITSFRRHSGCVSTLSRRKNQPGLVYVAVP